MRKLRYGPLRFIQRMPHSAIEIADKDDLEEIHGRARRIYGDRDGDKGVWCFDLLRENWKRNPDRFRVYRAKDRSLKGVIDISPISREGERLLREGGNETEIEKCVFGEQAAGAPAALHIGSVESGNPPDPSVAGVLNVAVARIALELWLRYPSIDKLIAVNYPTVSIASNGRLERNYHSLRALRRYGFRVVGRTVLGDEVYELGMADVGFGHVLPLIGDVVRSEQRRVVELLEEKWNELALGERFRGAGYLLLLLSLWALPEELEPALEKLVVSGNAVMIVSFLVETWNMRKRPSS